MTTSELKASISTLTEYQTKQIATQVQEYLHLNNELTAHNIPHIQENVKKPLHLLINLIDRMIWHSRFVIRPAYLAA